MAARKSAPPAASLSAGLAATLVAGLIAAVLLLPGCATHPQQRAGMERAMVRGDYATALAELDQHQKNPRDVLYRLDRGLLLHYLDRYGESNDEFEAAEIRIDELYTRSLSKEALSLVTSDNAVPYDGAPFERTLIHYYRMLNYLMVNNVEDALVECRKANQLLSTLANQTEGKRTAYRDDAFLQYLTALLYEDAGEWNDAWVSIRTAEAAFDSGATRFSVPPPRALGSDLRRLARELGYRDEYERYCARYPGVSDSLPLGDGELVLLFENGLAPIKLEKDLTLPILKGEPERFRDRHEFARALASRRDVYSYQQDELEYLLRVAVPQLQPRPPNIGSAEVRVGLDSARTVVVENVAALSQTALSEAMPGILAKTVLRGITKYLATREAEKKAGRIGGYLVNFLTAASERADTRGWISLPDDIQMARLAVPAGEHKVRLRFLDAAGAVVATAQMDSIVVVAGRRVYVAWREWE